MISNRSMPSYQRITPRTSLKSIVPLKLAISRAVKKEIPKSQSKELPRSNSKKNRRENSTRSNKELLKSKSSKTARVACVLDDEQIPTVSELEHKVGYCYCHYCTCNSHRCSKKNSLKFIKYPLSSYNKDFTGKSGKGLNKSANCAPKIVKYEKPPCKFLQFETTQRVDFVPHKSEPPRKQRHFVYKPLRQVCMSHYNREFMPWESSLDKPFRIPDQPISGHMMSFNANSTYGRYFNQNNPSAKIEKRNGDVRNLKLFDKEHVIEFDSVTHNTYTDQFDRHLQVNYKVPRVEIANLRIKGVNEKSSYKNDFQGKGQLLLLKRRAKE